MWFAAPSMCVIWICGASLMCCLIANARSKCAALDDVVVHIFCVHDTVDALSQNIPV